MVGKLRSVGRKLVEKHRELTVGAERAAVEAVNQLVVIGATLFIGVVVLASIGGAMPDTGEGGMFEGVMDTVESILTSSFELAAILPLVIIAAGLLWYVRTFNGNGNGDGSRR